MGEKKLYVNLLGEFSVWYGDKKVYMGRTSTGRQAQLFQLLMISPGFQISKEKLMADIYKSGEFNNRNNSVNNAIYRLRKMLTDAGVPGRRIYRH
ncbi:MAG: helix-turn-helix domain-containing protein [Clostridium sp.]